MAQVEGVNLFDLKAIVGHKNTATTEKYYYLDNDRLQKVVDLNPLNTQKLNPEEQLFFIYEQLKKFKTFKNLDVELRKDDKSVFLKVTL